MVTPVITDMARTSINNRYDVDEFAFGGGGGAEAKADDDVDDIDASGGNVECTNDNEFVMDNDYDNNIKNDSVNFDNHNGNGDDSHFFVIRRRKKQILFLSHRYSGVKQSMVRKTLF